MSSQLRWLARRRAGNFSRRGDCPPASNAGFDRCSLGRREWGARNTRAHQAAAFTPVRPLLFERVRNSHSRMPSGPSSSIRAKPADAAHASDGVGWLDRQHRGIRHHGFGSRDQNILASVRDGGRIIAAGSDVATVRRPAKFRPSSASSDIVHRPIVRHQPRRSRMASAESSVIPRGRAG